MEEEALGNEDLAKAQLASEAISEMMEKQILLRNFIIIEQNQQKFEDFQKDFEQALQDYQNKWHNIINELEVHVSQLKQYQEEKHLKEQIELKNKFENQDQIQMRQSSQFLDDHYRLQQLIKQRNYREAKFLKEQLEKQKQDDFEKFREKYIQKFNFKRENLLKRQQQEKDILALKIKQLIDERLQQKMDEEEMIHSKFQIIQNEILKEQNLKFSKIQAQNAKLLQKYNLNLQDFKENYLDGENKAVENESFIKKKDFFFEEYEAHSSAERVENQEQQKKFQKGKKIRQKINSDQDQFKDLSSQNNQQNFKQKRGSNNGKNSKKQKKSKKKQIEKGNQEEINQQEIFSQEKEFSESETESSSEEESSDSVEEEDFKIDLNKYSKFKLRLNQFLQCKKVRILKH